MKKNVCHVQNRTFIKTFWFLAIKQQFSIYLPKVLLLFNKKPPKLRNRSCNAALWRTECVTEAHFWTPSTTSHWFPCLNGKTPEEPDVLPWSRCFLTHLVHWYIWWLHFQMASLRFCFSSLPGAHDSLRSALRRPFIVTENELKAEAPSEGWNLG